MKTQVKLRVFQLIVIVLISIGVGYLLGNYKISAKWKDYRPIIGISNQNPPSSQNLDMHVFYNVIEKLNTSYYDKTKIDAQKMVNGAISGMLQSLGDPYTSFFPPKENTNFKTQLAGEFSGIGAELSLDGQNQVSVVAPLDGSPAQKAGIKSGDVIVKVDGKSTAGWDLPKAVENIRGKKGTKVLLTILRDKDKTPQDFEITRDTIQVKSVTSWVKQFNCNGKECTLANDCDLPAGGCKTIAYIRISQFGDKTNEEWMVAVNKILPQIESAKNFKGIILDVRNNPGGYLNDAVFIASEFIKEGAVVIQEDGQGKKEPLNVNRTGVLLDKPLVILINKGSASASEIVAGALQDYKRAKLIGENSFGKGTVQEAIDVDGGGSVHISIAKWLTPKERWVNGKGLIPDIEVKFDASESSKLKEKLDNQILRAVSELSK